MSIYQIVLTLPDSLLRVTSSADQTLLETMIQQHVPVRRACHNGSCGICKCRLKNGQIDYYERTPFGLSQDQIEQSYILPCIAYPVSDLDVDNLTLKLPRRL
jgi:ferredoxin